MEGEIKDITLFELDVFSTLSRRRSLRGVAREKGLTASHVSKVLRRLEKKLSRPLVKRSTSGVVLSPEGFKLLESAESILEHANFLQNRPSSLPTLEKKLLSIGAVAFLNSQLLSLGIPKLKSSEYRFRLLDISPDDLVHAGLKGAFEAAVHTGNLPWPNTWATERIGSLRWVLIGKKGHPLGSKTTEERISKFPFIIPNYWTSEGFSVGNDFCPLPLIERIRGHETSSARGAVEIAAATHQLIFVPRIAARSLIEQKRLMIIEVKEWKKNVSKEIFLSVKADAVTKKLQRDLRTTLGEFL